MPDVGKLNCDFTVHMRNMTESDINSIVSVLRSQIEEIIRNRKDNPSIDTACRYFR